MSQNKGIEEYNRWPEDIADYSSNDEDTRHINRSKKIEVMNKRIYDLKKQNITFNRKDDNALIYLKYKVGGDENDIIPLIIAPKLHYFSSSGLSLDDYNNIQMGIIIDDLSATDEERKFLHHINEIYERCLDYIVDNKKLFRIEKYDREDIKSNFRNPVFTKEDRSGKIKHYINARLTLSKEEEGQIKMQTEKNKKINGRIRLRNYLNDNNLSLPLYTRRETGYDHLEISQYTESMKVYPAISFPYLYFNRINANNFSLSISCRLFECIVNPVGGRRDGPQLITKEDLDKLNLN